MNQVKAVREPGGPFYKKEGHCRAAHYRSVLFGVADPWGRKLLCTWALCSSCFSCSSTSIWQFGQELQAPGFRSGCSSNALVLWQYEKGSYMFLYELSLLSCLKEAQGTIMVQFGALNIHEVLRGAESAICTAVARTLAVDDDVFQLAGDADGGKASWAQLGS